LLTRARARFPTLQKPEAAMTEEDHKPPLMLSGEELYSQIWATPMSRLNGLRGLTAGWNDLTH